MSGENDKRATIAVLTLFLTDERRRRVTAEGQVEELTLLLKQLRRRQDVRWWGRIECDCMLGAAARADEDGEVYGSNDDGCNSR